MTKLRTDTIINRDALYALRELPEESVHCCVTSPPYYALRDYGLDMQIGREDTPEQYIDRLTEVFRELRRVLRSDGTLWLNIADTYCGTGNNVDLFTSLNAVMKQNTGFYQSDLEIDKEIIAKAAVSPRKEDKTLLWFCRPSGTHCFRERDVFLKDTAPHNTWRSLHFAFRCRSPRKGFLPHSCGVFQRWHAPRSFGTFCPEVRLLAVLPQPGYPFSDGHSVFKVLSIDELP